MENTELEKQRDLVCLAITTNGEIDSPQEILNAIVQIPIRDALLRHLYDNPLTRSISAENLTFLFSNCVKHEKAAVATVLAGCYWLDADFSKTKDALTIALEADPNYSLARLLDVALTHGVPAKVWADSLAAVSPAQCLHGAA